VRRLRYLSIKSGDVYVTVRDMFKKDYLLTKTLEKVGAEDMQELLELLDEDIDRLNQVGDIVEEVVNFVLRGKCEKEMRFEDLAEDEYLRSRPGGTIVCEITPPDHSFTVESYIDIGATMGKTISYRCDILLDAFTTVDDVGELKEAFFNKICEELLSLFETQLAPDFPISIYSNRRRFRS
jgi:hypothetical protein